MPPDHIEISCAHCHSKLESPTVPAELFTCGKCGATLAADLVHVIHHVSTTVKAWPTDYHTEDPTPVQTPAPLQPLRRDEGE